MSMSNSATMRRMTGSCFSLGFQLRRFDCFIMDSAKPLAHVPSDAPRNRYTLRWDLTSYTTQTMPWWWVVETDRPDAPLVDVRVMHDSTKIDRSRTSRWIRGDLRILAGVLRPGQTYDIRPKLKYNPRGRPDPGGPQVQALTPGIRVELISYEPVGSDMLCTIRVTVLRREPGLLYEKINITAGGYSSPIWFIATLEN